MAATGASRWEWVAGVVGALVVLGAVGVLGWEAVTRDGSPPALAVAVDTVFPQPGGRWAVTVRVRNEGGTAAAGVVVEAEQRVPGAEPERGETTLDFVPPGGEREATFVFAGDPRAHPPEARVSGFHAP